jgi:hypothetical protein
VVRLRNLVNRDALLHRFLPRIAKAKGWLTIDGCGDHVEKSLEELKQVRFLHSKGSSTLSRWDKFHVRYRDMKPDLPLLQRLLVCFGVQEGYAFSERVPVLMDFVPGLQAAAAKSDTSGNAQAKCEREKLFYRCQNKLHMATAAIDNRKRGERFGRMVLDKQTRI